MLGARRRGAWHRGALGGGKHAPATASPLKDVACQPTVNLRLTLFSDSTSLVHLSATNGRCKLCFLFGGFVVGFFVVVVLFYFLNILLYEGRRYFKGWKCQG